MNPTHINLISLIVFLFFLFLSGFIPVQVQFGKRVLHSCHIRGTGGCCRVCCRRCRRCWGCWAVRITRWGGGRAINPAVVTVVVIVTAAWRVLVDHRGRAARVTSVLNAEAQQAAPVTVRIEQVRVADDNQQRLGTRDSYIEALGAGHKTEIEMAVLLQKLCRRAHSGDDDHTALLSLQLLTGAHRDIIVSSTMRGLAEQVLDLGDLLVIGSDHGDVGRRDAVFVHQVAHIFPHNLNLLHVKPTRTAALTGVFSFHAVEHQRETRVWQTAPVEHVVGDESTRGGLQSIVVEHLVRQAQNVRVAAVALQEHRQNARIVPSGVGKRGVGGQVTPVRRVRGNEALKQRDRQSAVLVIDRVGANNRPKLLWVAGKH
mmetsp:Transcript_54418/g.95018  ORF Transcript_54418/g.95018 Transcript_54418/m.95018 type:complete len:372 (+) Transcript_54418:93-1208(+)